MPDYSAIGTALAGRFAAAAMTAPTGYLAVRVSTTALPNEMTPLPTVLVFPGEGTFDTGNGTRLGTSRWTVRFYYDQTGDLSRAQTALLAWLTVLADQLKGAVQLGGTSMVARATIDSWSIGMLTYGGVDYVGIEFGVSITTTEGWAAVA
jgi:hypothetical protein